MKHEELSELQHMKELFKKLQELQYSTIGDPALYISVDTGGYLHSMTACVHVNEKCFKKNIKIFNLATFLSSQENEETYSSCVAFVNAHRTL